MKFAKKGIAVLTSAALVVGCSAPVWAADATVTKDENVFLTLGEDGNVQSQTVSNWLHSDAGLSQVQDYSTLDNIKNLKTDEVPQKEGDVITWSTEGNDLYYQGTTDQTPPVSAKISYTLDGKSITPQELEGKSGHVAITIQLTNNETSVEQIDGQQRTVCTPFFVVAAASFPTENFENIKAEHGTIQTDSSKQLACFLAMPGMNQTFDGLLDGKFSRLKDYFVDTITMEADAKNFEMPTVMMAASTSMEELHDLEDLPEISGQLDQLQDATNQLQSGIQDLATATGTMEEKMDQLAESYRTFDGGVDSAVEGAGKVKDGADALLTGTQQLAQGANALLTASTELQGAVAQAQQGIQSIQSQYQNIQQQYEAMAPTLEGLTQTLPGLKSSMTQQITGMAEEVAGSTAGQVYDQMKAALSSGGQINSSALASQVAGQLGENFDEATFQATLQAVQAAMGSQSQNLPSRSQVVAAAKQGAASDPQLQAGLQQMGSTIDSMNPSALSGQVGQMMQDTQKLMETTQGLMAKLSDGKDEDKSTLAGALNQLSAGMEGLPQGVQALEQGASQLSSGAADLQTGLQTLSGASKQVKQAVEQFAAGTHELNSGANTLRQGMDTYATDGIGKLTNAPELQELDSLSHVAKAVEDRANAYDSYTGSVDGVKSSVKFIYKLSGPEPQQEDTEATAQQTSTQQQDKSLWERIKDLF
jgi:putative membrane protein